MFNEDQHMQNQLKIAAELKAGPSGGFFTLKEETSFYLSCIFCKVHLYCHHTQKKGSRVRTQPFCVDFFYVHLVHTWVSSGCFGFLLQSRDIRIWLTGNYRLLVGVSVSVCSPCAGLTPPLTPSQPGLANMKQFNWHKKGQFHWTAEDKELSSAVCVCVCVIAEWRWEGQSRTTFIHAFWILHTTQYFPRLGSVQSSRFSFWHRKKVKCRNSSGFLHHSASFIDRSSTRELKTEVFSNLGV